VIIGDHTHERVDTLINNTTIGQTYCRLENVGATTIRMKGNKIVSIEYRNIPLAQYDEDAQTKDLVRQIENDPILGATVGTLAADVTSRAGFAQLIIDAIVEGADAEIGFYHYGGIRLFNHKAGNVMLATVYNLEPFESKIHTITMTPAQMRRMIIAKFNDKGNAKESHRVDLFSNTPYTIVTDNSSEAVDVRFPKLKEGRKYRVAMGDYIGKKYPSIEGENHSLCDILITDLIFKRFKEHSPLLLDNTQHQNIK
jgi:5'-nucleotidase